MTQIYKSAATLRIMGEKLVPSEVTRILGCTPSFEQKKGENIVNEKNGNQRIAISGMWRLAAKRYEPENLEGMELKSSSLQILSERGITLCFDIYSPDDSS